MGNHVCVLFLLIFLSLSPTSLSWGWFASSTSGEKPPENSGFSEGLVAEFQFDALNDPKAVELVDDVKGKIEGMNPCWFRAYRELFSSCSEIIADEEKKQRLAWHLTSCFQKDTGRNLFSTCSDKSAMVDCLSKLNDHDHKTFLEFYLHTNSISLLSWLLQTLKNMADYISVVLKHSKELKEQASGIAMSQVELLEGQGKLSEKLEENMARVQESYENLSQEVESLQKKAVDVKKEMNKVGEVMFSHMQTLQGKADNIADMAGISIDKQQELLQKQSMALEGLQSLTTFLSEALQESKYVVLPQPSPCH